MDVQVWRSTRKAAPFATSGHLSPLCFSAMCLGALWRSNNAIDLLWWCCFLIRGVSEKIWPKLVVFMGDLLGMTNDIQLCGDFNPPLYKDPYQTTRIQWKVRRFFSVVHLNKICFFFLWYLRYLLDTTQVATLSMLGKQRISQKGAIWLSCVRIVMSRLAINDHFFW